MNTTKSPTRTICFAVTALILTFPIQIAQAQGFEPTWQVEIDLAVVDPSGDAVSIDVGGAGVDLDFDTKAGAGLRVEYRFAESLAMEIGVLGTSSFDVTVGDLGDSVGVATRVSNFVPVTFGVNYHFVPEGRPDLYAGPFLAVVNYGDVDVEASTGEVGTRVSADTDFGWGAIAGVDVPIGSGNWSVQANIRYIETSWKGASDGGSFEGDFDPLIFSIGFGYRF